MKTGQSLIEILVAIGLTAVLLPGLLTAIVASREGKPQESRRLLATALLREAEEAVRSVREKGWSNLPANGTYHPEVVSGSWSLAAGSEPINGFTRQIAISDVYRDSNGAIALSAGTVDSSTKRVETTVSWTTPIASSLSQTNYLQRWVNNAAWTQTTQGEFNGGTLTSTVITNNSGGEVELAAGSGGDWASPVLVGSYDNSSGADGNGVFVDGNYAYLVTNNSGSEADLVIIDISTPSSPSQSGTLDLAINVRDVFVSGNYAYLATDSDSQELMVVNVANKPAPIVTASLNLGGTQNAFAVYVSGNYAYIGKDAGGGSNRELYVVDISSPTSPVQVGSYEAGSAVNDVHIVGNYAYLATNSNSQELLVVDISNPSTPSFEGAYDASSGANGQGVYVSGSAAYLVTLNNGAGDEFYIINASVPSSPALNGSFNVGDNSRDVFVSGNLAFVANDNNSWEFLVIDISTPLPSQYGFVNLNGDASGVFVSGDYAYAASTDDSVELAIIQGGSGAAYATSGIFESSTFDSGSEAAFNYLTFSIAKPLGTNVIFELAINNDGSTWNYFGSYESPGPVPLSSINGRYIRYRAMLTSDGLQTPVIEEVSLNYSP